VLVLVLTAVLVLVLTAARVLVRKAGRMVREPASVRAVSLTTRRWILSAPISRRPVQTRASPGSWRWA
jgi:hypothetical protein